ncbi:hypothetical protein BC937DRAFT_86901 [Endogone sp. FLAS-F59071]|nr:hypothetical protein BC937DRAFT_86901 [Endogone sp. FLAS-F59071]|eukprot:RUS19798.1 hypothetical protein BC937DRAFT_86901 [Endogone sp. FLAS-F59071]
MSSYPEQLIAHRPTVFLNQDPTSLIESTDNADTRAKKKPGRKPNPATPGRRKDANRIAQRLFRERKEQQMRQVEAEVKTLKIQRDRANAELDTSKAENAYLKNLVVKMQTTIMEHGLPMPQLQELETLQSNLNELGNESDNVIDVISSHDPTNPIGKPGSHDRFPSLSTQQHNANPATVQPQAKLQFETATPHAVTPTIASPQQDHFRSAETMSLDMLSWDFPKIVESLPLNHDFGMNTSISSRKFQGHIDEAFTESSEDCHFKIPEPTTYSLYDTNNINPSIQMRLRVQHYVTARHSTYSITPTPLQLVVPHDPRIDLIPSKHMRDRLIVFHGAYDLDSLVQMLLEKAVYQGGNPDNPYNWELPDEFFSEYWFCCVQSDVDTTNKWRSERGAPNVNVKPPSFAKLRKFARIAEVGFDNIVDQLLQESLSALSLK